MALIYNKKYTWIIVLTALILFSVEDTAQAYIGPGAGFAVMGSFLAVFAAIFAAIFALFTWPVRYVIRAIRGRHAFSHSRVKKVVIIGLDGMEPKLAEAYMAAGKLPHLASLRENGCYKPLATTVPSISPVAWSTFQTGVNPGKHNIFDFLTRDKQSYMPKLSSVDIIGTKRVLPLGKYRIPLGRPDIRLLRKSKPFWKILGDHGIFSNIIRVPITFPPEKFHGVQLSAMCVPDLRGTQGTFSHYTSSDPQKNGPTGGEIFQVTINDNTIKSKLVGCENPLLKDNSLLECPFTVTINKDGHSAKLKLNGENHTLTQGEYTDWVTVVFKAAPGVKVNGICKFLLKKLNPDFELYVTPINIDPAKPAMAISYPSVYSKYLAKSQGPYATLGLAEDSWALNEKVLDDAAFLRQCTDTDDERETMFFDSLEKVPHGLCVCVFDGTDRLQHTFWRYIDEEHPANENGARDTHLKNNPIEDVYRRMDEVVGKAMEKCQDKNTLLMVMSDHGFTSFRYGVDLNFWLMENGYLALNEETDKENKYLATVDWSRTRAFAIGLTGIYLNLKGREGKGIVENNGEAEKLRDEISEKLCTLKDQARNQDAIKNVYNAQKVYRGPYKDEAPDLIVGYHHGYRASWDTAIGRISDEVFLKNTKAWSGDHCIDPTLVPGVLFCNQKFDNDHPRIVDIAPTVLEMFGVKPPAYMDGTSFMAPHRN
ncbi:MAG: alkaline phosphatase family protein [Phycisphaerae bacterium]|nr:alkaline phosphatase family protein [Phycisphaerae bacterium]